jgi:hypothetical protein
LEEVDKNMTLPRLDPSLFLSVVFRSTVPQRPYYEYLRLLLSKWLSQERILAIPLILFQARNDMLKMGKCLDKSLHSSITYQLHHERVLEHQLERIKWYLWHGNVFRALQAGETLEEDLEMLEEKNVSIKKMLQAVREFNGYITANENYIVNYGDRYRNGETISTAFVESTVNEVISKRFVKKQQMRWTKAGAHNLLQVRTQVLNDDFYQLFRKWYPGMVEPSVSSEREKAA